MFRIPAVKMAQNHSDKGGLTYMYYWQYPSAIEEMGACHAVELAYVFNNLDETIYTGENIDPGLAHRVQDMWVGFASSGNPDTEGLVWPAYEKRQRWTMILDSTCYAKIDPISKQRAMLMPLTDKYTFNPQLSGMSLNVPSFYKYIVDIMITVGSFVAIAVVFIKSLKKKRRETE